ncbi:hypothetical protein OMO38_10055 [Chryseobacterium sp. 09-1422]|uniref:DUF4468 domain-containing protein n=1 Tax=Chryseobacterium kimseyorum TaxID=2984028 RepID=A0ABT3HYX9_9FLAO|nr:hypothetical protein [Chryseobacterium kimseyorum]MCW3168863.1 hypothetical protein [Chryseobacterium kimseyorum]
MMKLILYSMVIFSGLLFGQNIEPGKKIVQQINQIKDFKIKIVPNSYFTDKSEVTDNGIELKGFYKNRRLRKIEHFLGLSAWKIVTEYFFSDDGKLVFVHSQKYQILDENGYLKKPKLLSELKNYYENNTLIKTVGQIINDENKDYLNESKNLINDLKNYDH